MALDGGKSWISCGAVVARTVLASTLLLSACAAMFQLGSWIKLVSVLELFLGVAIAAGWHTRYAASLVLLGTLGMLCARLLAIPVPAAYWGSHNSSTTALLVASGFLLCFGGNDASGDILSVRENIGLSHPDLRTADGNFWGQDIEVMIRLENGPFASLHKRRCIVTFHNLSGRMPKTGREVWYARDDR